MMRSVGFFAVLLCAVALVLLCTACTITGRSAGLMSEEIVACSLNTDIEFLTLNDVVQACYRGNSLYFVVENTGTGYITGLGVQLGSDDGLYMTIRETIGPGETSQQSLSFGTQDVLGSGTLSVYPLTGEGREVCGSASISTVLGRC